MVACTEFIKCPWYPWTNGKKFFFCFFHHALFINSISGFGILIEFEFNFIRSLTLSSAHFHWMDTEWILSTAVPISVSANNNQFWKMSSFTCFEYYAHLIKCTWSINTPYEASTYFGYLRSKQTKIPFSLWPNGIWMSFA